MLLLYVASHSGPNARRSHWIIRTLTQISPHGLFDSNAFATNLDVIFTPEKSVAVTTGSDYTQQYPRTCQRVISALFPQPSGRGYIAYYAGPEPSEDGEEIARHCPLGVAYWSSGTSSNEVELDLFDMDRALADPITGPRFSLDYAEGVLDGVSRIDHGVS
jgi:hypothetical protein